MRRHLKRALSSVILLSAFSFSTSLLAVEYIVKYKDQNNFSSLQTFTSLNKIEQHEAGKLMLVDIPKVGFTSTLKDLRKDPNVEYVVENIQIKISPQLTNDPKSNEQWALEKVGAAKAWSLTKGDPSIVVAVIDTGIDWKHQDLKNQIWKNTAEIPGNGVDDDGNGYVDDVRGWDFFAGDNDPHDETGSRNPGHGTHCAGIVGATGDNGVGISGMAQNVTLMPIRFLGADGSGNLMNAVKSIDYATKNKAHIISASWGAAVSRDQAKPILEAIERARDQGILFVAAAANDGKSNDHREVYPANAGFTNVISVAASGPQDEKPSWSNFGRVTVDLAAPGLNILSTLPGNSYRNLSGTSMATPLVSGLASLVLSLAKKKGKDISPEEVKALLQSTTDKVNIETAVSGRVSAAKALDALNRDAFILTPFAKTLEANGTVKLGAFNGKGPFEFKTSNPEVASVSKEGVLTGKGKGQVEVTIKDSAGRTSSSKHFFVGRSDAPSGGKCPFQQPQLCQVMCRINPQLPWC